MGVEAAVGAEAEVQRGVERRGVAEAAVALGARAETKATGSEGAEILLNLEASVAEARGVLLARQVYRGVDRQRGTDRRRLSAPRLRAARLMISGMCRTLLEKGKILGMRNSDQSFHLSFYRPASSPKMNQTVPVTLYSKAHFSLHHTCRCDFEETSCQQPEARPGSSWERDIEQPALRIGAEQRCVLCFNEVT